MLKDTFSFFEDREKWRWFQEMLKRHTEPSGDEVDVESKGRWSEDDSGLLVWPLRSGLWGSAHSSLSLLLSWPPPRPLLSQAEQGQPLQASCLHSHVCTSLSEMFLTNGVAWNLSFPSSISQIVNNIVVITKNYTWKQNVFISNA